MSEVRIINSAIYSEPLTEYKDDLHPALLRLTEHSSDEEDFLENEILHLEDVPDILNCDTESSNTYRCENPSFAHLKRERRCKIFDDKNVCPEQETREIKIKCRQVPRITVSSPNVANKINEAPTRRLSHEDWLREKANKLLNKKAEQRRFQKIISNQKEDKEKIARENMEKEKLDRENFVRWLKQKQQEKLMTKKKTTKEEQELQKKMNDLNETYDVMKKILVTQWAVKKKIEKKAQIVEEKKHKQKKEEEMKLKKTRSEESSKAFEIWFKKSKNIPKPPTQGLLPHQSAKPSYVNPKPWQSVTDEEYAKCEN